MPAVIGMKEMDAIFAVTDPMGISREAITVPLQRKDPGEVAEIGGGQLRIIVPASTEIEAWVSVLRTELEKLGYHTSG
jgi:hypothetical protein